MHNEFPGGSTDATAPSKNFNTYLFSQEPIT